MKIKKPVCLIAAALAALLSVPAEAKMPPGIYGGSTEIEAECVIPDVEIQVNVPAGADLCINPLGLPVEINGEISNEQILCETSYIENQSVVPLVVDASVIGAVKEGSDMVLSASSTESSTSTSKRAFFYFEMQAVDDPAQVEWYGAYDSNEHIVVRTYAKTKRSIATLGAAGAEGCYGAFHLAGDCIAAPKNEWTEADGVNVTITFTFTPIREA